MLADIFYRLRSLFRRNAVEAELDEELRFHFERETAKLEATGLPRQEAMRRARLAVGAAEQVKEECREARGIYFLDTVLRDIRYAGRVLARTPVITAVAVLSLALGVGANTAIFSLMDAVLLKLLPVQHPEELFRVERLNKSGDHMTSLTNPLWEAIRDRQDVFAGAFAWSDTRLDLSRGGEASYAEGLQVSAGYFATLGVRAATGRLIANHDDQKDCRDVAVLSNGFWRERFGAAPGVVGQAISLNNHSFEIIGVTAAGFFGTEVGRHFDVAIPVCATRTLRGDDGRLTGRSTWWLQVMGRLKPGISAEQASARLQVLSPGIMEAALPQEWAADEKTDFLQRTMVLIPGAQGVSSLRQQYERPLEILMAIVGLVLLIACANIATLMLSRGAVREREMAMRKALGASRGRLVQQLLTECLLLSLAGAFLGFFFARWGNAILLLFFSNHQHGIFLDLTPDLRVLGFTTAIAILTGLLFGALPALLSTRVSLASAMKGASGGEKDRHTHFRPGKWIVASQVALSLVLLVAAGLFLRSLVKLVTLDLGFDRSNVLTVHADLKAAGVSPEQIPVVFDQIEARLRALPGVTSAAQSIRLPGSNFEWNENVVTDSPNQPKGENRLVFINFVSPGFFETLRTPLLTGRDFRRTDTKTASKVAIVNQVMARRFFGDTGPLGKYFRFEDSPGKLQDPILVVGLVRDSKYESFREDTFPQAFFPIWQCPESMAEENFELRTAARPSALALAVQEAVAGVNKGISIESRTLAETVEEDISQERLLATLSAFFGALALLLAMIGLYGAISYLVTQRQAEFGIRRAIGAPPLSILGLVMKDVLAILAVGLTAGAAISLATLQVLQKMLFGLAPRDAATLLAAIVVFSAVALLAGYIPARRAMRIDPMTALRHE